MAEEIKTGIVEAVASGSMRNSRHGNLGKRIEKAMSDAVRDAMDQGIHDPVVIRERMMQARQAVKDEDIKAAAAQNKAG